MNTPLDELLDHRKLIIAVGPGGVGKTTTAAAMALRAARRGRRAVVITVDPAKRLADALGLDGLHDEVRMVDLGASPDHGGGDETARPGGALGAAMLDTKASYDALLTRITRPEDRARIFGNRAYQAFSRTMARSHAYVAMERLLHVVEEGDWDLVVLDTPPTRSALDILDAPKRLSRFLDERIIQWFLGGDTGPDDDGRSKGPRFGVGKLLGALVGGGVVGELLSFFGVLAHLRQGFADRAQRATTLLTDPNTAFVLAAAPMPTGLADAANLRDELLAREIALSAVIYNRAYRFEPGHPDTPVAPRAPLPSTLPDLAAALSRLRAQLAKSNAADRVRVQRFAAETPTSLQIALPLFDGDLTSLQDLDALLTTQLRVSAG